MTYLSFDATIARPIAEVYRLAADIENHPRLIPDYLSCRVLERRANQVLFERTAEIQGKEMSWQSWASFKPNKGIYFTHLGGPLDGMHLNWIFEPVSHHATRMTITQEFHIRHWLPFFGRYLETYVFGPKLSAIASRVIQRFKEACEMSIKEAV